jgi:hypothetical protein
MRTFDALNPQVVGDPGQDYDLHGIDHGQGHVRPSRDAL